MTEHISNRIKVSNSLTGIVILTDSDGFELNRADAEGLYVHLGEALAVTRGYEEVTIPVQDIDPEEGDKLRIGLYNYRVTNLLSSRDDMYVVQLEDDDGEEVEFKVHEDFLFTVWRVIQ